MMSPSQIIVLATPVFLLLMAVEFAYGYVRQRRGRGVNTYRLNDAITSVSLGMLSQLSAVFTGLLRIGIYTTVYSQLAFVSNVTTQVFWFSLPGWLVALVFYDFCYYWLHRMGHESAVLWAAHVVHHQSQDYNLSTALRQTSSGTLFGWVFYLPMALAGVPPLVFGVVALVDLLYQFWVHTEHIGKLGWFDRWFCSPSNHRVHHAVNDGYLDKNYGGILILWDRLFGTFTEEADEHPCVYGTRGGLNSFDPLWANAEVYWALANDSWRAKNWGDKLRIWFKPPGWRPAELALRFPKPAFEIQRVQTFDPPVSTSVLWFGGLQFLVLMVGVLQFLWVADSTPLPVMSVWLAVLTVALWAVGGVLQGRLSVLEVLMVDAAALATATGALGMADLHHVFKPLVLSLALVFIAHGAYANAPKSPAQRFDTLFAGGLAASLLGDCFLMFPGYFVPGLAAFLTAHLFYIARFKQGTPWFPHKPVLVMALAYAVGMYSFIASHHLPVGLRLPVAVYALVIALMAAQAVGRAWLRRDRASLWVGVGALLFVLSDTLLAVNKFVMPLGVEGVVGAVGLDGSLWVLSTYFAAQLQLIRGCVGDASTAPQKTPSLTASTQTGQTVNQSSWPTTL